MTAITCIYCGVEGVLNVRGLENNDSLKVFKRVGRNHVSGHLHYQCPVCKIVLLVDSAQVGKSDHIFKHEVAEYPLISQVSTSNLPVTYTACHHCCV